VKYWIWSNEHGAWWAKDRRGYVRTLEDAGMYDAEQAEEIVTNASVAQMDQPALKRRVVAIPVST